MHSPLSVNTINRDYFLDHLLVVKNSRTEFTHKTRSDWKLVNSMIKLFRYIFYPSSRMDRVVPILSSEIRAYTAESFDNARQAFLNTNIFIDTVVSKHSAEMRDSLINVSKDRFKSDLVATLTFENSPLDSNETHIDSDTILMKIEHYIKSSDSIDLLNVQDIEDYFYNRLTRAFYDEIKDWITLNPNIDHRKIADSLVNLLSYFTETKTKTVSSSLQSTVNDITLIAYSTHPWDEENGNSDLNQGNDLLPSSNSVNNHDDDETVETNDNSSTSTIIKEEDPDEDYSSDDSQEINPGSLNFKRVLQEDLSK